MARNESDREDLLAEGVNLPRRGRITSTDDDHEWIVGWRAETAVSVFDDVDPVYQFNTSGYLRRVYIAGEKLAAQNGRLARLVRLNDPAGRMTMQGQLLSASQQDDVLQRLTASIDRLSRTLSSGRFQIETIGVSEDVFAERLRALLASVDFTQIAASPNVVDPA